MDGTVPLIFAPGVAGAPTTLATSYSDASTTFQPLQPSDFKATVDWGDGSPAQPAAIVETTIEGDPAMAVLGAHAYARPGSYPVTVTVVGDDGIPDIVTETATVAAPAPPPVASPVPAPVASPVPAPVASPVLAPVPTPVLPTLAVPVAISAPVAPRVVPPGPPPGPTVLPSPFPRFAPTIAKNPAPVGSKPTRHPAPKAAKRHVAAKPVHVALSKKHPAGPARLAKSHH